MRMLVLEIVTPFEHRSIPLKTPIEKERQHHQKRPGKKEKDSLMIETLAR